MDASFHRRYLTLVEEIERGFPVAQWRRGDVDIWPLARMDLYLDMHRRRTGEAPPAARALPLRVASNVLRPLVNVWRSRRDLAHHVARPRLAHAIFLGDGVSLDRVDGAWQDRYGEPLIAALERRGLRSFLMQSGDLSRLPWHRPTFAANVVEARGWLGAFAVAGATRLPQHEQVLRFLAGNGVEAPSLAPAKLARRAAVVSATASAFERVLKRVRPKMAFVVTCYAGLGHAFVLACRRQAILSVDLQHCPQDGAHKAYRWSLLPDGGFTTLSALFWNWTEKDAADIRRWTGTLASPWHQSLHGGHTQLAGFQDAAWNARWTAIAGNPHFEREILIALQPIGGRRAVWDALADAIEAAPPGWRWWIRRHPSSRVRQDAQFGRLLMMRRANVVIDPPLPLPALLRHMSVLLSLASGAAAEAAMFGVPAVFLGEDARGPFGDLIARGCASVIDVRDVGAEIAKLPPAPARPPDRQPDLDATLRRLEEIAGDYVRLCRPARDRAEAGRPT